MAAMLHQQKRVAKFDKMIRNRRLQLPRVGMVTVATEVIEAPVEVVETEQPRNYQGDEWEAATDSGHGVGNMADAVDYARLAMESL